MNSPVVTDVFKFLAVRPAQRVSEKETAQTIIRDKRATTADGRQELAILARTLSSSRAAMAHWKELDLSLLEPLADGYRQILHSYEHLDVDDNLPDAKSLLKEAGLATVKDGRDPKLNRAAWLALYTAHATGSDAGPRLETPMAALRVLHFAQALADVSPPSASTALGLLRATVVIPASFQDAIIAPLSPSTPAHPPLDAALDSRLALDATRRSAQVRALAADIYATGRLLESVTNAPMLENASVQQVSQAPNTEWSTRFNLSTVPSLNDALPAQLTRGEAMILDHLRIGETTLAPHAAQTLQLYLQKLTDEATLLADDPEFATALRETRAATSLTIAALPPKSILPSSAPNVVAPDVDVSGRITPLGIGDLKVVKQTLLAYVAGEVAHIENVLKGESKERTHRKLDRTETTLFTSEEETKDLQRDTQSTDRFELKRETEQTLKEDMSVKAGLTVTATYGPVVATATGDFAYSTSKQESQKNSSNFAREIVDRSITKVQTKTKTERTTKTLNEVEEINRHALNNGAPSTANVTGIYRWVDKQYRAQVYNYGVRLLLEFVIPEPAAFYRAMHAGKAVNVNAKPPPAFVTDGLIGAAKPLTADSITEFNYARYAAKYAVTGVLAPPPLFTYIGLALAQTKELGLGEPGRGAISSKDFLVPAGYILNSYSIAASILWSLNAPQFNVQVRGDVWEIIHSADHAGGAPMMRRLIGAPAIDSAHATGSVPVSVACYDVYSFALNIQGLCVRTEDTMAKWRLDTFGKLQTAYQALQTAYDQKVTQAESAAGITIQGQNPATNRIVEKNELKKLCITMMTGQHFKQFGAMTEPPDNAATPPEVDVFEALYEGPIIQFFEQAFEWEQMTYLYYPYFWGRKKNWQNVTNQTDPDPMFQQFLKAGAARVLVPVPMAYINDVQFLLQNPLKETELRKKVWRGGETPIIGSALYESIAEEMRDQTDDLAGATPEGEPWEFTLPTTLVWLQPDDTLPTFP